MRTIIAVTAAAMALSFSAATAQAGGWGSNTRYKNTQSSGLVNVSPTVRTGNLGVLNGMRVLNNSPIASGNVVSGILSGNTTGVGILGTGNSLLKGVLGGGNSKKNKR